MRYPVRKSDELKKALQANRRALAAALCALAVVVLGGTAVAVNAASSSGDQIASPVGANSPAGSLDGGSGEMGQAPWNTIPGGAPVNPDGSTPAVPGIGVPNATTPNGTVPGGVPTPGGDPNVTVPGVPSPTSPPAPGTPTGNANPSNNASPLTVETTASNLATYAPISFAAAVPQTTGAIRRVTWSYGDGTSSQADLTACDGSPSRATTNHSYRSAGTYVVTATATIGTRCGVRGADATLVRSTTVTVGQGTASSNGPLFPTVILDGRGIMPEDPHVSIDALLNDFDGYVSQVTFDWNEAGSTPTIIEYPLDACTDTPQQWPVSNRTTTATHDYTEAGTYRVTVTVTSVGCDGQSSQQAIGVLEVTAGGTASRLGV